MTNLMNQKVGGSKAASPAKCGAQSSKNKKVAAPVCVFENPEFGMVRTATDEKGEPWFCAKDLCDALGYKRATDAVRQHVRSSDTAKYRIARTVKNRFGVSEGKVQNVQMNFVNESGFYALVLGSKLASALKFKDWVTSVVLPQIRKTGGYIPVHEGESEEEMIRNAEEILRATLKEKEMLLEQQKKLLHQQEVQLGLDKKLIDEQDVADALNAGKLRCAAVDVVSVEPIVGSNPLLTAKNCIITPHMSWAATEARARIVDITAGNIRAFLKGRPRNVVNP